MSANVAEQVIQNLEVLKDELIGAPIDIVFESLLEQMGPYNETPDNNSGHYWGTVQSIKPPALLEIQGPLFMSAPVISHLMYRLTAEAGQTRLKFSHRAIGQIAPELLDGSRIGGGWSYLFSRVRANAENKVKEMK
jgi:hypothetical protein